MAEVGALRISLGLNSTDFTNGLKSVNTRLTALNTEFRAITSGAARFDNSLESLRNRADVLTRTMQVHQQKVQELNRRYEESKRTKGEDADETIRLASAYNRAVTAMNNAEQQLQSVNRQIDNQTSSFGQLEREVNSSLSSVDRQLRVLQSGFDASITDIQRFGNSTDVLRERESHLSEAFQLQQRRVSELTRLYQESARTKGNDAEETQELQIRLNRATQEMRSTEQQLESTTREISQQTNVWRVLGKRVREAGQNMQDVGGQMQSVGSDISQSFGAATLAIGAGLGFTAKKAMDFESQISSVKSVMSPDEVETFGDAIESLASEMGAKTKFSAMEAAQGIEELIKAGVSVTDIMGGGLEGALSLAVAGELELADAAEIASTALNAFKDDNLSVIRAADLLAGAANASATSVGELKYGLSMVSAVASGIGLSFEDTTSALATFAQNGLKGSDAGTSLKTMLLNLTPASDAAGDTMMELGLLTKDGASAFYDAEGSVRSLSEIAGALKKSLKGLSDEQRQVALKTMFGTDAIRAANILYKEGAEGIDNMTASMNKIKSADVAATKLDNVKGRIEMLKGSAETAAISFGNALLPSIDKVTASLQKATDWFNNLNPELRENIAQTALVTAGITGVATALGIGLAVVGTAVTGFGALTTAAAGLGTAFTIATGPVGIITAGIIGLTAAGIAFVKHKGDEDNALKNSINVNLEHANSLLEQKNSMEQLTAEYQALREKNQLSNKELLLFRDLQSDLKTATSAAEIETIKKGMQGLQENSGLSNKELERMLNLNDEIVKKSPTVNQAISDQGSAIIENVDQLKNVNKELRDSLNTELELQKVKAEAKLTEDIEKRLKAIREYKEANDELASAQVEQAEKQAELNKAQREYDEAKAAGDETAVLFAQKTLNILQAEVDEQDKNVAKIAEEVEQKNQAKIKTEEQLVKTVELYDQLVNVQLAAAGINEKGAEGISQLDQAISKTENRIGQLSRIRQEQGGLNEQQQAEYEKLTDNLGVYRNTRGAISDLKTEQSEVNDRIDSGKRKAEGMNTELSKNTTKNVKVTDNGSISDLNKKASAPVTKTVSIQFSQEDIAVSLKNRMNPRVQGAYATGTRNAPPGLAWVGEEGPELIRLKGGEKIIPNGDSEAVMNNWENNNRLSLNLLRKWNIPMFASGTTSAPAGLVLAGEMGRELIYSGDQAAQPPSIATTNSFDDSEIKSLLRQLVAKSSSIYLNGDILGSFVDSDQAQRMGYSDRRLAL